MAAVVNAFAVDIWLLWWKEFIVFFPPRPASSRAYARCWAFSVGAIFFAQEAAPRGLEIAKSTSTLLLNTMGVVVRFTTRSVRDHREDAGYICGHS